MAIDYSAFAFPKSQPKVRPNRARVAGRLVLRGAEYEKQWAKVYERDKGMCRVCEPKHWIPFEMATLDHKYRRGMGGADRDDSRRNLQLACMKGNQRKGSGR